MAGGALQALDVEVRFIGDASGTTNLAFAEQWAGERDLGRWARDMRVDGARAVEHPQSGLWRIRAAPGAALVARYRVVSAYDSDPEAGDVKQAWPIIRPGWFYVVGESLFAVPRPEVDAPATFVWRGEGSGLRFASDLQHLSSPTGRGARPGTVGDVRQSIALGGRDVQVTGDLGGVRIATLGPLPFPIADFDALARRIVTFERGFWGDDTSAPFLVTAAPLRTLPAVGSFSGAGRGDAFALWLDGNATLDRMRWLLSHELFHTWNAAQLGGSGRFREAPPIMWFSEGFTEYYARATAVRSGVAAPADFARVWNEVLRDYAASPARTAPNARIAATYWKDPSLQDAPYQRGALLAVLWNARLRHASGGRLGLDDVLHAQRDDVRAHPDPARDATMRFIETARRFGLDVRADVARYVEGGAEVVLPPDAFGSCARVARFDGPAYDRGFDAEATVKNDMAITGLKPGSTAAAAGLRDGMKVLKREGEPGDASVPLVLTVDDKGTERVIRYLPAGAARLVRQRLELTPGADPKACARSLSGL